MKCIIIDDEATAIEILYNHCTKINGLEVLKTFDNAGDALNFLDLHEIDLIFLDIHMPVLSGYEFLDALSKRPKIVLTTSDHNLAIKAYEYKCIVDFLGKPYSFPRFINSINKVNRSFKIEKCKELSPIKTEKINDLYINIDKKLVRIKVNDIDYIKTLNKKVQICTNNQNYLIKSSLSKILVKLPKFKFLKVHQSYIINITKIIDIKNNNILINNDSIPVSRLNKAELLRRINLI
ncbi:LytR/AlgR family response regulator transcription factor [Geojedonia litorea]|uniref:LytR/AlgR family response regulator transcription factor n=1 Tax=Geojedonia litorea TaxID=1268269 RepID=A0ABV9N8J9_9FLAO